jgi:hypothetical protein
VCALDCSGNGATCPVGMECTMFNDGSTVCM